MLPNPDQSFKCASLARKLTWQGLQGASSIFYQLLPGFLPWGRFLPQWLPNRTYKRPPIISAAAAGGLFGTWKRLAVGVLWHIISDGELRVTQVARSRETNSPIRRAAKAIPSFPLLLICPRATGGQFLMAAQKRSLGDPGAEIRRTIRPGNSGGVGQRGCGGGGGGGHVRRVRLFFHAPSFPSYNPPSPSIFLCKVEEKRGAVKLERVPDIWSLLIAPRDAREKN